MCLILAKEPGAEPDLSKIESAVINNPHGWGYLIPDREKLIVRRHFDKNGTDPEDVISFLEDSKDEAVLLHLRYTTAGEQSKANTHPFQTLTKRKDGHQVFMMHNGTLHDYKQHNDPFSDTHHFNEKFAKPIMKRFLAFNGPDYLFKDPILAEVLKKQIGFNSVVIFVDERGRTLPINKDQGTVFKDDNEKEWWVSNTYSFNDYHRYKHIPAKTEKVEPKEATVITLPSSVENTHKSYNNDLAPYGKNRDNEYATTYEQMGIDKVETLIQYWDLPDYTSFKHMSRSDFFDLVCDYPDEAAFLIYDLVWEMYGDK